MIEYTENDLLRIAKRFHNKKRTYLLVDPLQAKHIPVSPSKALEMFHAFGKKVKTECPDARLVIGFAETATAVGMAVAEELGGECVYIHTTRENIDSVHEWVEFKEEHSHAVQQKLAVDDFEKWLKGSKTIVFVDDEISTGKTLINFVKQLKERFPGLKNKEMVAASIISRVSKKDRDRMTQHGIRSVSLLSLENVDYSERTNCIEISEALKPDENHAEAIVQNLVTDLKLKDPRIGISAEVYEGNVLRLANKVIETLSEERRCGRILVLGTEECMYPAIIIGKKLEENGCEVYTHSTTRSPIGISNLDDYPICSGYKLSSIYDDSRITYIYNLGKYDTVLIVTDSKVNSKQGIQSLIDALKQKGNDVILLIRG